MVAVASTCGFGMRVALTNSWWSRSLSDAFRHTYFEDSGAEARDRPTVRSLGAYLRRHACSVCHREEKTFVSAASEPPAHWFPADAPVSQSLWAVPRRDRVLGLCTACGAADREHMMQADEAAAMLGVSAQEFAGLCELGGAKFLPHFVFRALAQPVHPVALGDVTAQAFVPSGPAHVAPLPAWTSLMEHHSHRLCLPHVQHHETASFYRERDIRRMHAIAHSRLDEQRVLAPGPSGSPATGTDLVMVRCGQLVWRVPRYLLAASKPVRCYSQVRGADDPLWYQSSDLVVWTRPKSRLAVFEEDHPVVN